jgi:phytanoyl-CoA hydroxylase
MDAMDTDPIPEPFPALEEPATLDADPRQIAATLPLDTRFELGAQITPVQNAFLDLHGFLVFSQVATSEEVQTLLDEAVRIQDTLHASGQERVNGIPIWFGKGVDGEPFIQRLPFTSLFSDVIHAFVRDPRFEPIRTLIGSNARVGDNEKDGVVLNRYIRTPGSLRPGLGWHTDGLRDLFYGRMPARMLNVGIHMHRIRPEDGGLRLIPGTHEQGFLSMAFRKPYFVSHGADPNEIAVETWPGDLTLHDGRLWHRVQASPKTGLESYRCSMYVPYLTHAYDPKDENSKTPLYTRIFDRALKLKSWWLG